MIAVLYAEAKSVYKRFAWADVYDQQRDARTFSGDAPVIAHPPCRTWAKLAHMSTAPQSEKELAHHAIACVRANGGALEHPQGSKLFGEFLPLPGERDSHGWTLPIDQGPFGHPAKKRTFLYIVGVTPCDLPAFPCWGYAQSTVEKQHSGQRNATPYAFALWLLELAERTRIHRLKADA